MPDLERARARFEAKAIIHGLDIAKYTNGHDYDSERPSATGWVSAGR